MSYMSEYINQNFDIRQLEQELINLINEYDTLTGKHLFIYSVDFNNYDLPISMDMNDLYTIKDVLREDSSKKLSFYIETPGGSGTAAEEIAILLRNKYEYVDFIVVGECKSAGTILAMCGDEIYLNDTGSLGPIDAQIQIGRSTGSAHDYMKWIHDKMDEADKNGKLNNFDALMVAQITPNELIGVQNSLDYGKELVTKFLKEYKFKNWKITETHQNSVSDDLRQKRAEEIADKLSDHSLWKTHGRSLKIDTLRKELQLKICDIASDEKVCEIVERIQVILRLIFSLSPAYKIIADKDNRLIKTAMEMSSNESTIPSVIKINVECDKCGTTHELHLNVFDNPQIENELNQQGLKLFPKNNIMKCNCGCIIDLNETRKNIYETLFNK